MVGSLTLDELLFDSKEFTFLTGHTFRGLTVSQTGAGWNIVLRSFGPQLEPLYAMTQHVDPHEGLQLLLGALATRTGNQLWRKDQYFKPSE